MGVGLDMSSIPSPVRFVWRQSKLVFFGAYDFGCTHLFVLWRGRRHMTVTFFGHADTPREVEPLLEATLRDLIEHHGATLFYVGDKGNFDHMVRAQLRRLAQEYPHIRFETVLAYMPGKKQAFDDADTSDTIFPEGLERAHPRYAIASRNRWMVEQSDTVVAYVSRQVGGAAQFAALAHKKGKQIINLSK